MRIPVWLALAIAALVTLFGLYRLWLGFTLTAEAEAQAKKRGGVYGMGKRFHLLIGVVYILMGAALTAIAFGWEPFGSAVSTDTAAPSKDTAPTKTGVPIDQLPATK